MKSNLNKIRSLSKKNYVNRFIFYALSCPRSRGLVP
jgi:hypothetical protein